MPTVTDESWRFVQPSIELDGGRARVTCSCGWHGRWGEPNYVNQQAQFRWNLHLMRNHGMFADLIYPER